MSNIAPQGRYNETESDFPKDAYHLSELACQIVCKNKTSVQLNWELFLARLNLLWTVAQVAHQSSGLSSAELMHSIFRQAYPAK